MKTLVLLAVGAVAWATVETVPVDEHVVVPAMTVQGEFDHAAHSGLGTCTTCHADVAGGDAYPAPTFCAQCHNGTVQPEVEWLPPRAGSQFGLAFDHADHVGLDQCATCHVSDGVVVRADADACMQCHGFTEHVDGDAETCAVCHTQGAVPSSHDLLWADAHGVQAAAAPEACASCHVRADCLACHRPGAASPPGGYHPADFLSSHPTAAYGQGFACASCHNTQQFCQDCHNTAGLVTGGPDDGVYHDGTGAFTVGHGQAARQSLGTCVSCHRELDCVKCHIVLNPHGPDFNAERQARTARSACSVCHGGNVPVP
jgi:hypothetical protein